MPRRATWTREQVRDVAVTQYGLITSAQLKDLGVPRSTVLWSEQQLGGMFTFVLPGVHAFEAGQQLTSIQRLAAAQLYAGPEGTVTGAAVLRFRKVRAAHHQAFGAADDVHVLVPHGSKRGSTGFAVVERTTSPPVATVDGLLRMAPTYRAVMDASRRCTDEEAVRALLFEVVQRGLASPEAINDERLKGQKRGTRFARLALEQVFAGARSIPEGEMAAMLEAAGLGRLLLNPSISTIAGSFVARPDAYDPESGVCVEVDSREHHFAVDTWEATMRRHARMVAAGLIPLHVTPGRIRQEPDAVVGDIWSAIRSAGVRDLTHLRVVPVAA